jgi:hypothetical protein
MKKILSHLFRGLLMFSLALGIFAGSFFYEGSVKQTIASQQGNQVILKVETKEKATVNRGGEELPLTDGKVMELGDIINSGESRSMILTFARDGELRLDSRTKVLLSYADDENLAYSFKLLEGRIWLNNIYSTADINLNLEGAVVFPGQSVVYANQNSGVAGVYVHSNDAVVGIVPVEFSGTKILTEMDSEVINKLYLPTGTSVSVYADKVKENLTTISKLLFSKMVKEFNFSIFDRVTLSTDTWLSDNVAKDNAMTTRIRDARLKDIRTRGLKYSTLDAQNYKVDQILRDTANSFTFSDAKVGKRNLDALYDLLNDSKYLFDYNRKQEAQERLDSFVKMADQVFLIYGEDLKKQYIERVKSEYEYLSFANPSDSLFQLKQVLQKIYLDSIKGQKDELFMRFEFLKQDLSTIGWYADNNESKKIDAIFEQYMTSFKALTEQYEKEVSSNITYVQRQNQSLDNLFTQYAAFYREKYFTKKLFVENKYLSLLPEGKDKSEEIQNVIAQRIDFLRRLQNFFLDGKVPLTDAKNIMALLFSEISKIELPGDYQVAVKALFTDRLQDYGIFSKFLNTPEYVSSNVRGTTPRQRFEAYKRDNPQEISLEQMTREATQLLNGGDYEPGKMTVIEEPQQPQINEEVVVTNADGQISTTQNQVDSNTTTTDTSKVKVPRVKRTN